MSSTTDPNERFANRAMADAVQAWRRLRAARDLDELRALAGADACAFCGFDRSLVLTIADGALRAGGAAVAHEPSDVLRRRALAQPADLTPGSAEAELVRRAEAGARTASRGTSVLASVLDLEHFVLAPVVPEDEAIAVLVVDRANRPVADHEVVRVEVYAAVLAVAVEHTVLRTRLAELAAEFRHLATSALAMGQEALTAPVTMSTDHGWGAVFPRPAEARPAPAPDLGRDLLTGREQEVLAQLAAGRSNREIAQELHLAPDTVKTHVARVLRKLNAANRAEAVGRWLAMTRSPRA